MTLPAAGWCAHRATPTTKRTAAFKRPHGVFDTEAAAKAFGLLVDRPEIWHERWLAGSIPGWDFNITDARPSALYQPRYLSDSGRLFFDSPDELVPAGRQRQGGRL